LGCIEDARSFCADFLDYYNDEHRHSAIGYHTRASVHFGTAPEIRAGRPLVLASARAVHPERFVNGAPTPPPLPGPAWINKPKGEPAQIIR
jgi:putative transposase